MFGTCKGLGILFHGEYLFPAAGKRESNHIPACAGERVNKNCFGCWSGGYLLCDFAGARVSYMHESIDLDWTDLAIGSGVTPNQASSVSQMPSSYLEKML